MQLQQMYKKERTVSFAFVFFLRLRRSHSETEEFA